MLISINLGYCLVAGIFATIVCTAVSGMVPVWMQVDPAVQELAGTYFFILYLPMLFRSASILFGTVLRAAGDTKTPMRVGIIVNCINIVLNFLLIYDTRTVSLLGLRFAIPGAGWGVTGAAAASALSYVWGGIHITWVLWRHPLVSPKGMSLKPDMSILRPCVKIAFPNMLQRFGTSLGYVVFAAMINSLGEVATAAHTIANTVESAFYIPAWATPLDRNSGMASRIDKPVTSWECPYIFLFGGTAADGSLIPGVTRGVINRFTFKPIY